MSNLFKAGSYGTPANYTGVFVSDSAYGQPIPYAFGKVRLGGKCIIYENLTGHKGGGKKGSKKNNTTIFDADADFIIGYGPMEGYTQSAWVNGTWYYQTYSSQTFTGAGLGTVFNFTINNNPSGLQVYLIMGVAYQIPYSVAYSDYAAPTVTRSFTQSGNTWVPLYNNITLAPNSGLWQNANIPYATYNSALMNPTVTVTFPTAVTNPVVIVYYIHATSGGGFVQTLAQVTADTHAALPSSGLVFERILGTGPVGDVSYPEFSGIGGTQLPLGASQTFSQYRPEVKALFCLGNQAPAVNVDFTAGTGGTNFTYQPVTASGDCNPADVILDLVTSGNHIAFAGAPTTYTTSIGTGWGVSGNPFPVNKHLQNFNLGVEVDAVRNWSGFSSATAAHPVLQVTSLCSICVGGGTHIDYSIDGGTTFNSIQYNTGFFGGNAYTVRTDYATLPSNFDVSQVTVQATVQNFANRPVNDVNLQINSIQIVDGTSTVNALWNHGLGFTNFNPNNLAIQGYFYSRWGGILADESNIWPGTYGNNGTNLGLNAIRNYCHAYGIYISGVLESQQTAAQVMDTLCEIANCDAVWNGVSLDYIPRCEISNYANGASYVATSAAGPTYNIVMNDFITEKDGPPVTYTHARQDTIANSLQIGFADATIQYNNNHVIVSDAQDIMQQGSIPGDIKSYDYITNSTVALAVGYTQLRRQIFVRDTYKFRLSPKWGAILTPKVLVTIPWNSMASDSGNDAPNDLDSILIPIWITKISENDDLSIEVEAEQFYYGAHAPIPPTQSNSTGGGTGGGGGGGGAPPVNINTPIIFEAIPKIASVPQLWFCVSASLQDGGCNVWLSTDGGATYSQIGVIAGNQTMGVTYSNDYPLHVDPDNADTLNVDLTESVTTLGNFSTAQQNNFDSLCLLTPGGTVTLANGTILTIPYELVAYGIATLSAANKYALAPPIRRGVYNTPVADHPINSNFSYILDGNVFKWDLPASLVGVTLNFKFQAFNVSGTQTQDLSGCIVYPFTPSGQVGFNQQTYTISPQPTVYQGQAGGWAGIDPNSGTWTNTGDVYFPSVTATFNTGTVLTYAARDAGISGGAGFAAGGVQVWVTIFDPTYIGEPNGVASLPTYVDQNQTRWNTPGYIRIGTLVSVSGGGGGGGGGGNGGLTPASDNYIYIPPAAGTYTTIQELYYSIPVRGLSMPQNLIGSHAGCRVAPTGSVSVTLNKNGVSFGTVNIGAGLTTATFTVNAAVTFNGTTDIFQVVAPAGVDATFAGFWMDLAVLRTS